MAYQKQKYTKKSNYSKNSSYKPNYSKQSKNNYEKSSYNKQKQDGDYNMIKGRVAEALVEQLFLKMGFNVYRYGMENTIPSIMKLIKGVNHDVENVIRKMPDFVVQKDKQTYFVEVKFRKSEKFSIEDIEKEYYKHEYPFPNAYFVVVSSKHIKCISYNELKKENKKIKQDDNKFYLANREEFFKDKYADRETIINFCNYARKFFENV